MLRTLILGLSFIAAAPAAAADAAETAPAPASDASAGGAAVKHAKQGAKPRAGHAASVADKADPAAAPPGGDVKMSGMSILGNEDSPKSLVLVPWKSSQLGDMPGVARLLDASTQPVDKDVFMRELAYYEFKSGSK